MSIPADVESLILELAYPLPFPQQDAFVAAARAVLTATGCSGVGAAYRLLGPIQRAHWDAPDLRADMQGARHLRSSKLRDAAALDPAREDRARAALWSRRGA
jgi:hypothetical protein